MNAADVIPYLLPLVIGAFQWLAGRSIRDLDDSRRRMGERIGELEKKVESLSDRHTRLETRSEAHDDKLDMIAADVRSISHDMKMLGQRLAAETGRTQSSASMPAVQVPPRPRMPSRPGDR